MNNILILGGGGWSGKFFLNYVIKQKLYLNFNFTAVDKNFNSNYSNISIIKGDLSDRVFLKELISDLRPYYVVNFAGLFKSDNVEDVLVANFTISYNLLSVIVEIGVNPKNILLVGSAAEYGEQGQTLISETSKPNPINLYGLTKSLQVNLMAFHKKNHGTKVCLARPFNLVGKEMPKSLALGSFISQINTCKNGNSISVGNLNSKRDFIHIKDAIKAYWLLLEHGESGEVYNVCSGKTYKMESLLRKLISYSRKNLSINIVEDSKQKKDLNTSCGSNNKIFNCTGWKPTIDVLSSLLEHF